MRANNLIWIICLLVICHTSEYFSSMVEEYSKTINKELKQDTKKVAILCPAHIRRTNGDPVRGANSFRNFLEYYARMDCPYFDRIVIIWNQQKSPEHFNITNHDHLYKKEVYFLQTIKNTLRHRYIIAPWIDQNLFFSTDDDFFIECQKIKSLIEKWNSEAVGTVGPIFGGWPNSHYIYKNPNNFNLSFYSDSKKFHNWFSMIGPGNTILPRIAIDINYAGLPQFQLIDQKVQLSKYCDDISLYFKVYYLFPQLDSYYFNRKISKQSKDIGNSQHTQKQFTDNRNDCINYFSTVLKRNPLNYFPLPQVNFEQILPIPHKTKPFDAIFMNLKKQYIETYLLSHKNYYLYIKHVYGYNIDETKKLMINQQNKILNKPKSQKEKMILQGQIDITYFRQKAVRKGTTSDSQTKNQVELLDTNYSKLTMPDDSFKRFVKSICAKQNIPELSEEYFLETELQNIKKNNSIQRLAFIIIYVLTLIFMSIFICYYRRKSQIISLNASGRSQEKLQEQQQLQNV